MNHFQYKSNEPYAEDVVYASAKPSKTWSRAGV